jgi:hypothetical protein
MPPSPSLRITVNSRGAWAAARAPVKSVGVSMPWGSAAVSSTAAIIHATSSARPGSSATACFRNAWRSEAGRSLAACTTALARW